MARVEAVPDGADTFLELRPLIFRHLGGQIAHAVGQTTLPGRSGKARLDRLDDPRRRVTPGIKRQMKRRAAVEPVIGHMKNGHRMDRNFLAHQQGDAINPILAAAGYTFRLILKWIRILCAFFPLTIDANQTPLSTQIAV